MKIFFINFIIIFIFLGCASDQFTKNEIQVSHKTYKDISKYELLNAVKKVFKNSPDDLIIDTYLNKVEIVKTITSFEIFNINIVNKNYNFVVQEDDNKTLNATISISKSDENNKNIKYLNKSNPSYDKFWAKVDAIISKVK